LTEKSITAACFLPFPGQILAPGQIPVREVSQVDALQSVLADLAAESSWLDALLAPLADDAWRTPTPAEGWTIAHQVAHLAWTDAQAVLAATDPEAFGALVTRMLAGEVTVDSAAAQGARQQPAALLHSWRTTRDDLAMALSTAPKGTRLLWFGPPMSATSMATARLMETWAHGQDIADALSTPHPATTRLRNVAEIAVRTRDFAFTVHGLTPPAEPFAIRLAAPDNTEWEWGPQDAKQRITGTALDFCLVATRRRHRLDTALKTEGPDADRWLDIAQAFAGPPGPGRRPAREPRG
jgi:uncharacterized protein (TIGR03084 family)